MKTHIISKFKKIGLTLISALLVVGCQYEDNDLQDVKNSKDPNVFIDTFSGGLNYAAFSNTDIFAFQVDSDVTYNNSSASMRVDVPNEGDVAGAYAGGSFFTTVGRDLSDYNVLTFWAKSSKAATLGVVGFGIDLGANANPVSLENLRISTVWRKYYIPVPDPSKLKSEKGLFYFSAGPENGDGYSFWIDEVKFENLGTIAHGKALINDGENKIVTSYSGVVTSIAGVKSSFNLPTGINQAISISPTFLEYTSSNPAVASVDSAGKVTTGSVIGSAVITATFGGVPCSGSLTINSKGTFLYAPVPTLPPSRVISVFSDKYNNVPVSNGYNGYWQPWQTTLSDNFSVNGDNILNYTVFNFVGIECSNPTINATDMTNFHMDVFIPGPVSDSRELRIILVDFGANGAYSGGDDTRHSTMFSKYTPTSLKTGEWISINIPLSSLTGLGSKSHLAQIILEGGDGSNIYVDNIYFNN